jgi:simple sugar transport system ATP-binding protein
MVKQHPLLTPGFSCWEACYLGCEPGTWWHVDKKKAQFRLQELSDTWGFDISANQRIDTLTISQKQKVAILALLIQNVQYIILDEPTAVLTPLETERLFTLLRQLRASGKGIVIISHKLSETLAISDRVTILRKGKTVAVQESKKVSMQELSTLMFSIEVPQQVVERSLPDSRHISIQPTLRYTSGSPPVALKVQNLVVEVPGRVHIRSVNFNVQQGEIVGIAGVRDSGLESLELALTGFIPIQQGSIEVCGVSIGGKGPGAFRRASGGYVSADRLNTAVAIKLPLWDTMVVHAHRRFIYPWLRPFEILRIRSLTSWVQEVLQSAGVPGSFRDPTESFSGGMLQRLILAREFAEAPSVLVLAEPGWGLDMAGKKLLVERIHSYVRAGGSVVLLSTDIEELLELSHRILVLHNGNIAAEYMISEETLKNEDIYSAISMAMVTGSVSNAQEVLDETT